MKKAIISAYIVMIIVITLFHLAFSYINWDINPLTWPIKNRAFVAVLGGFISIVLSVAVFFNVNDDKEDKQ